jgi:hypothetical protein
MQEDEDQIENRSESRTTMVYRPLLVEGEEFVGFCLAKNISSAGMMGRFYTDCEVGAPVTVHFNDFIAIPGSIVWSNDGKIGVKFDVPIDVAEILAELARPRKQGKVNRAPRLPIEAKGEVICEGRTLPVELKDISQNGVKLRTHYLLKGDEALITVDGLETRKAIVKWASDGHAGLHFLRPLDFKQLSEWAVRAQMGE